MARRPKELQAVRGAAIFLALGLVQGTLTALGWLGAHGTMRPVLALAWGVVAILGAHELRRAWPRWRAVRDAEPGLVAASRLGREVPGLAELVLTVPTASVPEVAARLANAVTRRLGVGEGLRRRDLDTAIAADGTAFHDARAYECARMATNARSREDLADVVYEAYHALDGDEVAVGGLLRATSAPQQPA